MMGNVENARVLRDPSVLNVLKYGMLQLPDRHRGHLFTR